MTTPPPTFLHRLLNARSGELSVVVLAFLYHFCLLCGYYAIRPLRDTFGIERGADALPYLYTGTAVVTLLLHPLFAKAVSRWPRRVFIPVTYNFFVAKLLLFYVLVQVLPTDTGITVGETLVSWMELLGYVFFVWLSAFNVIIVSVFWSFMNDLFSRDQGKRLFGPLASGGSVGAIVGGATAWTLSERIGADSMILVSIVFLEGCVLCAWLLSRQISSDTHDSQRDTRVGGGAFSGVGHVLRSPYLLGIALLMVLMTIGNTYFYTQQAEIVSGAFESRDERSSFFGMLDFWTNALTWVLQLFIVSRLLKRFGVVTTIVALPIIFVIAFVALAFNPTLGVLGVAMVASRSGRYALMRPAREVLYTVVSREDKYKAKNLNDTFVYRGGDLVGIWSDWLMRVVRMPNAGIALTGAGVAAGMGVVAFALGRRQETMARRLESGVTSSATSQEPA
ncbi:MAG: NTP/NDP exchange transporter [Planctomycetota bacterium]|jgi:AAA family ATP:ADP antiporter